MHVLWGEAARLEYSTWGGGGGWRMVQVFSHTGLSLGFDLRYFEFFLCHPLPPFPNSGHKEKNCQDAYLD